MYDPSSSNISGADDVAFFIEKTEVSGVGMAISRGVVFSSVGKGCEISRKYVQPTVVQKKHVTA